MTRIWSGPLDVDGLALESVRVAADAAAHLAAARGRPCTVTTSPQAVGLSFAAHEHLRVDGEAWQAWAPLSGFFAAADGWLRLHGNYPHHAAALLRSLDLPADAEGEAARERVSRALGALPALEAEERIVAAGGIAAAVRSPAQWRAHPHARAVAGEAWIDVEEGAERDAPVGETAPGAAELPGGGPIGSGRPHEGPGASAAPRPLAGPGTAPRPLAGLRVLDLTRVIAGPTASQLLGCLGADVLRLDPPHRPEILGQHLCTGLGKRSAELDLRRDAALLHERLLPEADVILLGYRPGALDRFGLAPAALAERHPHLVVGALSAWGDHGPWGGRAGFDSIVQAATGIATLTGNGERPGALPVQALDHATGCRLAAAVMDLLALGRGGVVRASLRGAADALLARPAGSGPFAAGPVPGPGDLLEVDSPHGRIRAVPVPLRLDGEVPAAGIGRYGGAEISWPSV